MPLQIPELHIISSFLPQAPVPRAVVAKVGGEDSALGHRIIRGFIFYFKLTFYILGSYNVHNMLR